MKPTQHHLIDTALPHLKLRCNRLAAAAIAATIAALTFSVVPLLDINSFPKPEAKLSLPVGFSRIKIAPGLSSCDIAALAGNPISSAIKEDCQSLKRIIAEVPQYSIVLTNLNIPSGHGGADVMLQRSALAALKAAKAPAPGVLYIQTQMIALDQIKYAIHPPEIHIFQYDAAVLDQWSNVHPQSVQPSAMYLIDMEAFGRAHSKAAHNFLHTAPLPHQNLDIYPRFDFRLAVGRLDNLCGAVRYHRTPRHQTRFAQHQQG